MSEAELETGRLGQFRDDARVGEVALLLPDAGEGAPQKGVRVLAGGRDGDDETIREGRRRKARISASG